MQEIITPKNRFLRNVVMSGGSGPMFATKRLVDQSRPYGVVVGHGCGF